MGSIDFYGTGIYTTWRQTSKEKIANVQRELALATHSTNMQVLIERFSIFHCFFFIARLCL